MDSIFGTVGVWDGCGFDTIELIYPPPTVLGYNACVTPTVTNPVEGPRVIVTV